MALSGELRPGMFTELFATLAAEAEMRARVALEETAELIEERARQSVSARSHPRNTRTPASRGGPPAMVSGTLAKSIGHSAAAMSGTGMSIKVGMVAGHKPPYKSNADSSMYAYYLEVAGAGRARVKYPFLQKAFEQVAHIGLATTFIRAFSAPWG